MRVGDAEYLRAMTRIIAGATRALARAHEQRIAHRDIKPANILLNDRRSDRVYLCDFGLGRDLEIATTEQMRDGAGTPMYMAPERLLRVPADEVRCDIYSMGVTLFEALTLQRPIEIHDHVTLQTLPAFLATAPVRRPSDVRPWFPEELEDVILKAMDRDPARRFGSCKNSRTPSIGLRAARRPDGREPRSTGHDQRSRTHLISPGSRPQVTRRRIRCRDRPDCVPADRRLAPRRCRARQRLSGRWIVASGPNRMCLLACPANRSPGKIARRRPNRSKIERAAASRPATIVLASPGPTPLSVDDSIPDDTGVPASRSSEQINATT